jgi:hypothetical protein
VSCGDRVSEHNFDADAARSLPSAAELPRSAVELLGGPSGFETTKPSGNRPPHVLFGVGVERPHPVGIVDFDSLPEIPNERTDASIQIRVYEHRSAPDASAFWKQWPIEKAHTSNVSFSDEILDAEQGAKLLPNIRFGIGGGLEREGICTSAQPYEFMGSEVKGCEGWTGWVHFCNWTMDIGIWVRTPLEAKYLSVDHPRSPRIMRDVASVVMDKVGCDPPREGV